MPTKGKEPKPVQALVMLEGFDSLFTEDLDTPPTTALVQVTC